MATSIPEKPRHRGIAPVHGDYLDTRIRNTRAELDSYPPAIDQLLDRILDEFGLIVCGWSAEWDGALRTAIERVQARRFTTFWAARGELGDEGRKLIALRRAEVLEIKDADSFFRDIRQHVESIEEFSKPHPLSTEAAVASLKRYISDTRYRIQLTDLVDAEIERVIDMTSTDTYAAQGVPSPDTVSVTARIRGYEAACSTLLAMAAVGGYWAEEEHCAIWQRALARLYPADLRNGMVLWLDLKKYPATLLFYALGLGAVEAGRLAFLGNLFGTMVGRRENDDLTAAEALPPLCMFEQNGRAMQILEGMEKHHVPLNDWLHDALRETLRRIVPDDHQYTLSFDKFEVLVGLACGYKCEPGFLDYWAPPGAFGYRTRNRNRIVQEIRNSLEKEGNSSDFRTSGMFGETPEECLAELAKLEKFVNGLRWW